MMYIILELMGEYVEVERATSNGRTSALPQPGLPLHPPLQQQKWEITLPMSARQHP